MGSEPPTLAALPPELIQSVAEFLDSDDLACFSLCNHQLFTFLQAQRRRRRTHCENALPFEDDHVRMSIVKRLERDLPNYFTCHTCNKLHRCDAQTVLVSVGQTSGEPANFPVLARCLSGPGQKAWGFACFLGCTQFPALTFASHIFSSP
jgi:hypothetical protein